MKRNPPLVFSFRRLNHNSDFSFLHIKNPVGDSHQQDLSNNQKKRDRVYSVSFLYIAREGIPITTIVDLLREGVA